MSNIHILVPLAEGFEEIEAIVPIDIWRRAGFKVTTVGLKEGMVQASRQTIHFPDTTLVTMIDEPFNLIYIPGGRPGADNLAAEASLLERLRRQVAEDQWIAAICAGPLVLAKAGLLKSKLFACHPSVVSELQPPEKEQRVVVDGKLVTGQAAGSAMDLAFTVVRLLVDEEKVEEVNRGLCYPYLDEADALLSSGEQSQSIIKS